MKQLNKMAFNSEQSLARISSLLYHKLDFTTNKTRALVKEYGGFTKQKSNLKKIENDFTAFLDFVSKKFNVTFSRHKVKRQERLEPYRDDNGNFISNDEWSDYAQTSDDF